MTPALISEQPSLRLLFLLSSLLPLLLLLAAPPGSLAATCDQSRNVTLSTSMVAALVTRIQKRIVQITTNDTDGRRYYPLVPGCIRLAFHACAATHCSSFVNLSDPINNGLQPVIAIVDALRSEVVQQDPATWSGFSKADMYALCGVAALELATNYTRSCVFRYGRPDFCPNRGDSEAALGVRLPRRSFGTEETFAYFRQMFNFSEAETVAIQSAHSLGVLHELGTLRPLARWTSNAAHAYSNQYYCKLLNSSWTAHTVEYAGALVSPLYEWRQPATSRRLMLDSDMAMAIRVTVTDATTGRPQCTAYSQCGAAPAAAAAAVRAYCADRQLALDAFVGAFARMIENGLKGRLQDVKP